MSSQFFQALSHYLRARERVVEAGYGNEIAWQEAIAPESMTESDLLRETAWVVLCSGFREETVRARFSQISLCFCDWESSEEIVRNAESCLQTAIYSFANRRKISAIIATAHILAISGFQSIKARILSDPINTLLRFDQIGEVTAYHLAKNLGFQLAKHDRHLARLSGAFGFQDAAALCETISQETGDPINKVDIVLWRDCVLNQTGRFKNNFPGGKTDG